MRARVKVLPSQYTNVMCSFAPFNSFFSFYLKDEEPRMTEIWYTPHDENRIEEIFEAMKHCQSLHPDPNGLYAKFLALEVIS